MAEAIKTIPTGETRTIVQLGRMLAVEGNADTTCPATTVKYWKWLAHAYDETVKDERFIVPCWRVLKDGKPSRHMPGGTERQISLLNGEGVKFL
ncbi:MAG: MGMT family protein [Spirochaetales bacterium]|nr:MGMT family protein [Spirochaetales bacterium]